MKKFYYTLFLVISFISVKAQIVDIPDANFKTLLLTANPGLVIAFDAAGNTMAIDTNQDGEIQFSEAEEVYELIVLGSYLGQNIQIYDLTGIEAFISLTKLDCSNNELTNLEISSLTNLKELSCNHNNFTSLDFSALTNLMILNCSYNTELALLNVQGLNNLMELTCIDTNNLSSIDLSGLQNLTRLSLSRHFNLEYLNLSGNIGLTEIRVMLNPSLREVVGTHDLISLRDFYCHQCKIKELDFSNSYFLENLDLSDNEGLDYLNLKNGSNFLGFSEIYHGPNGLKYICIDEFDFPELDFSNLPEGMFINTYCLYNPGGIYNIISGNILFDSNNDGICEGTIDFPQHFIKIKATDGTYHDYTFTDDVGAFTFHTEDGTYSLTPEIVQNPEWFNITPITAEITFPLLDGSTQTQNFCITPNGNFPDLEVVISPLEPARPGFEATYKVVYRNKGNQTISGTIEFEFEDDYMDFISSNPVPATQSTGLLNYDFTELNPFETREIFLSFDVNAPTDTPPVNIDDILIFSAQINPTDENPEDNTFVLRQTVVGSYDPNDILCLEGESVNPEMIGKELHYRIRFENTGNFPAERVVVAMPIHPNEYDISSFQLLNTSHPVQARIVNNTAEFFFENINLVPNGEGDILLSMKSLETLSVGDAVMSYADIYFDYNFPITTNEAETVFELLGLMESDSQAQITLYPNPVKDNFTVLSDSKIKQIELYDTAGRLLKVSLINDLESIQTISSFSSGTYFVKIYTEKGITVQKIIKR